MCNVMKWLHLKYQHTKKNVVSFFATKLLRLFDL